MGNRITVVFTDGDVVSKEALEYRWIGSTVGITIEEIWDQFVTTSNLSECASVLSKKERQLHTDPHFGFVSNTVPKIIHLDKDEIKNPRLLDSGDNGVVVVNIKTGMIKNLRGTRWSRNYTIKEFADKCRRGYR